MIETWNFICRFHLRAVCNRLYFVAKKKNITQNGQICKCPLAYGFVGFRRKWNNKESTCRVKLIAYGWTFIFIWKIGTKSLFAYIWQVHPSCVIPQLLCNIVGLQFHTFVYNACSVYPVSLIKHSFIRVNTSTNRKDSTQWMCRLWRE